MTNNDFYFKELDVEFKGTEILKDFIPKATWEYVPYMNLCNNFEWDTTDTASKIRNVDEFINEVYSRFKGRQRLYKIYGESSYNWHQDAFTEFSLNMVLDNYDCKTIFEISKIDNNMSKIKELKYIPGKWYLFNSQIRHMVVNSDMRDRVLYTILFYKKHGVKLQDFIDWYELYV